MNIRTEISRYLPAFTNFLLILVSFFNKFQYVANMLQGYCLKWQKKIEVNFCRNIIPTHSNYHKKVKMEKATGNSKKNPKSVHLREDGCKNVEPYSNSCNFQSFRGRCLKLGMLAANGSCIYLPYFFIICNEGNFIFYQST